MRTVSRWLIGLLLFSIVQAGSAQTPTSRPFHLGFTPFPYAISFEAVDYTYERIAADADLILHHFDNGVPWVEALAQQPFHQNLRDDWFYRRARIPDDHVVGVSITPINFLRDGLAPYRGELEDMPLPAPWDSYTFDHPDVIAAYLYYAESAIDFFDPDFLMFGIEVNLLMRNNPSLWDSYMVLHREVYTTLKQAHPDLMLFVSVTGIDLVEGYTEANHPDQLRALADISDQTDILGLSVYPYFTGYMTNLIPRRLFADIAELTDKPLAISETGYPAQTFNIFVNGIRVELASDEQKQADWMAYLLESAYEYEFQFIINFVVRDYDQLWEAIGALEDLTIAWRDTGLYDENGVERLALRLWRDALALPHQSG
jgi:hypothetical protein